MKGKLFKYSEYILFVVLFFSAFHGINALTFSNGIVFNAVDFIFAILFLLSMILISVLSLKNKIKTAIFSFLGYWTTVILIYNTSELLDIDWLENTAEIIISPFASIFYILWQFTDGETATALGSLSAYYIIPVLMILYSTVMILIYKKRIRGDFIVNYDKTI